MPVLFALAAAPAAQAQAPVATPSATPATAKAPSNLDAFMARVLERRDEGWRKLHDYILSERENFDLVGPGGVRLDGRRREFSWYVRDGYLVRSPVRYDGVAIGETDRRQYEARWLEEEKARQKRAAAKKPPAPQPTETAPPAAAGTSPQTSGGGAPALEGFIDERGEPRFISESFFLKFKFEPGNYYFAGRERLDGRDVVRIEYYPTKLFGGHEGHRDSTAGDARRKDGGKANAEAEDRIERDLNKVALVTLWIDPAEYQIVRYKFDNVDFGFLPARWLFRLDNLTVSMTMARVLDGVWLPQAIEAHASLKLATGGYGFEYGREFYDHKKAQTSARIREYGTPDR